ncbi:MAG: histidinol-phosphatase [Bacteroidota bacterium]
MSPSGLPKFGILQNLHTHTNFSDGSDDPGVYVHEAIRQGFLSLGFSDHSPLPFDNSFALREDQTEEYCKTILSLKEQYSEKTINCSEIRSREGQKNDNSTFPSPGISIFLGLEVDFIPGMGHTPDYFRKRFPLDYYIGSVHLVKNPEVEELWFIDGPVIKTFDNGLAKVFAGNGRKGVTAYYRQIQEMVSTFKPDIVGHLDKIKMHNWDRFFSETDSWYIKLVDDTLDIIRENGCVVEVNTRGIYKNRSDSLFPGPAILEKIIQRKIPACLCSDAHKPEEIAMYFGEAKNELHKIGFRELMYLTPGGWTAEPIFV